MYILKPIHVMHQYKNLSIYKHIWKTFLVFLSKVVETAQEILFFLHALKRMVS